MTLGPGRTARRVSDGVLDVLDTLRDGTPWTTGAIVDDTGRCRVRIRSLLRTAVACGWVTSTRQRLSGTGGRPVWLDSEHTITAAGLALVS